MSNRLSALLLTTTMLSALPALAFAQSVPSEPAAQQVAAQDERGVTDVIVTAQKRSERLQDVPISIQALTSDKLDALNISNFNDFAALLPSVSFQNSTPGTANVYIRGVASGGDGNHSGPLPSVGIYLDEQPVTTIGGAVDVRIYDIARIESLAGPQGTLYGASSEAGTIRIISNKPELGKFYGRADAEANTITNGTAGGSLEAMVNIPIANKAALRLVGWVSHTGGFIDNVAGSRTYLGAPNGRGGFLPGIKANNSGFIEDDFNDVDIFGGRAALKIDLDENWTATASLMAQDQKANGVFGYDASVGDLKVQRFFPDNSHDQFYQAALTLQGKVGIFDVTYAGSHMERKEESQSDYSDYAEAYDQLYAGAGGVANYFYFTDSAGATIDSRQKIVGKDDFTKLSHELRFASPSENPFRVVFGGFMQRQTHDILQDYQVPRLSAAMSVNGRPGTLWLTNQERIDRDLALFGEATFDLTPKLTFTAGARAFSYENSLIGFFGFGRNVAGPPFNAAGSSRTGVAGCYTTTGAIVRDNPMGTRVAPVVAGSPCTNLGVFNSNGSISPKVAKGDGTTYRLNLNYKVTPDILIYGTLSTGFRPGGINRRATLAPYQADTLRNTEIGWKTTLFNRTLRFNGAIYMQKWKKFQFAFLGQNSFTEIQNGPDAKITGIEADVAWYPTTQLTLNVSGAFTDAKTEKNLCAAIDPTFTCAGSSISAPKGTRLPITPRVKLGATGRYEWDWNGKTPYTQVVIAYRSSASSDLRVAAAQSLGDMPESTTVDWSIGTDWNAWSAEFFIQNLTDERAQITRYQACSVCTQHTYSVVETPRTFGIKFGANF